LGWLKRTLTITLDFDWLYRGLGRALQYEFQIKGSAAWAAFVNRTYRAVVRFLEQIYRHHGPQGVLARAWPTGSMAFWATLLLGAYLIAYYL
ncbi:MAG: Na(+)/H(+) antiporter subunit D, partial [Alphaproteobacteria bacterium]